MNFLFDNKLAPVTSEIGFLEVDHAAAVAAFVSWQKPIQENRGVVLCERLVEGSLNQVLKTLNPLTSVERRRFLFVPTFSTRWVAYFDNGHRGTDATSVISFLAKRIGCMGIRVVAIPDQKEVSASGASGQHGATIMEVYGQDDTDFLNYIRSVSVTNDGKKWCFSQAGVPFHFENLSNYKNREVKERFTGELLESYLNDFGISPFNEDFYMPSGTKASLVEKSGPSAPGMQQFSMPSLG